MDGRWEIRRERRFQKIVRMADCVVCRVKGFRLDGKGVEGRREFCPWG